MIRFGRKKSNSSTAEIKYMGLDSAGVVLPKNKIILIKKIFGYVRVLLIYSNWALFQRLRRLKLTIMPWQISWS